MFKGKSKLFDLLEGCYISERSQTQDYILNYSTHIRYFLKQAKLIYLLEVKAAFIVGVGGT